MLIWACMSCWLICAGCLIRARVCAFEQTCSRGCNLELHPPSGDSRALDCATLSGVRQFLQLLLPREQAVNVQNVTVFTEILRATGCHHPHKGGPADGSGAAECHRSARRRSLQRQGRQCHHPDGRHAQRKHRLIWHGLIT